MALPSLSISMRSRMLARTTRVTRPFFVSTSKRRVKLPARRKTRCDCRPAPRRTVTDPALQPFEDPDATFVRSITYRSTDGHRFDSISKQITDLKKEVTKREQQKKEMADVVDQDSLIELKGRRPVKLPEVFVRPALDGKRLPGEVEIHQNGLRYQSPMGSQKIGKISRVASYACAA